MLLHTGILDQLEMVTSIISVLTLRAYQRNMWYVLQSYLFFYSYLDLMYISSKQQQQQPQQQQQQQQQQNKPENE